MDKGRLEAFSDGVFAVAITLLVFDLAVPHVGQGRLASALGHEWPQAAAFVVSFMVIGIIWINHHAVLGLIKQADRVILAVNLALLLPVVSIPFATNLFATYLAGGGDDARLAAAVYSGVMTVMSVAFSGLYLAVLQ
jgi:uncharacterized membrane protein